MDNFAKLYGWPEEPDEIRRLTNLYESHGITTYADLANSQIGDIAIRLGAQYVNDINQSIPWSEADLLRKQWESYGLSGFDLVGDYRRKADTIDALIMISTRYKQYFITHLPHLDGSVISDIYSDTMECLVQLDSQHPVRKLIIYGNIRLKDYGGALLYFTDTPNGAYADFFAKMGYMLTGTDGIHAIGRRDFTNEEEIFEYYNILYVPPEDRKVNIIPRFNTLSKILKLKWGQYYYLSNIICSGAGQACNPLSEKISKSLVRVASTRIFSDPYQSIMEPIVNSIDAYHGGKPIGKFGLGFYSLFFWLFQPIEGTKSRYPKIIILSRTVDEFWFATIKNVDGELAIQFLNPYDQSINGLYPDEIYPEGATGTVVGLMEMNKTTIRNFAEYTQRFFTDVPVVTAPNLNWQMDKPTVIIVDNKSNFGFINRFILDRSTGITMETFLNSTLIPTSSTKSIQSQGIPYLRGVDISTEAKITGLMILVNDVGVVHIHSKVGSPTYMIFLENVDVPVSRDDIILNSNILTLLESAFIELVNLCIAKNYELDDVMRQFVAYANYTDQQGVGEIIQRVRQYILARSDLLLLPSRQIVTLMRQGGYHNVNYLSDINLVESRNKLDRLFDSILGSEAGRDVFQNVRLIHLLGKFSPTDAGIPGYLFVDNSQINVNDLINSYQGALLRRANDPVSGIDVMKLFPRESTKTTYHVFETPYNIQFPTSILIHNNKFMNRNPFRGINEETYPTHMIDSIYVPNLKISEVYELNTTYSSETQLLYSTIESWVLSLSEKVIINVTEPGRYASGIGDIHRKLFIFDDKLPIKRSIINAIFEHCLVTICTFFTVKDDNKHLEEYMATLCQFFTHIRIEVGQGSSKRFWFGRVVPYGWLRKEQIEQNGTKTGRSNENIFTISEITPYDLPLYNKFQRDGFFLSLKRILDDKLYLRDDIYLLDSRFFIDVALNNLYHILSQSYNIKINLRIFIRKILNAVTSNFEITLVCDILFTFVMEHVKTTTSYHELILINLYHKILDGSICDIILLELRKRFPSIFFTQYLQEPLVPESQAWITNTVYVPMSKALEIYLNLHFKNVRSCQFRRLPYKQLYQEITGLSLQKMIKYIFDHNVTVNTFSNLVDLANNVNAWIPDTAGPQLQMVEIAVNSGTTKPFINSILTELLQNSLDAIKTSANIGVNSINVSYCAIKSRFQLLVADYGEIPESALLSLMISFLSSKSATSDGATKVATTGEMGTGFFNVYRQPWSEVVSVRSGNFLIEGRVVSENGIVRDIIYDIYYAPDRSPTFVMINSAELSDEIITDVSLDVNIYAQDFLGVLDVPIYFNEKLMNRELVSIYEDDVGWVKMSKVGVHQSVIMTNGVPFGSLISFLESMFGPIENGLLATNLVVNINKGYYAPTQGRNRLNKFKDERYEQTVKFLSISMVSATMAKLVDADDSLFERYMSGALSRVSLDQYSVGSVPNFYVFNKKILFNRWYDISFVNSPGNNILYHNIWTMIMSGYQSTTNPVNVVNEATTGSFVIAGLPPELVDMYIGSSFEKVVNRWFSNKLPVVHRTITIDNSIKATTIRNTGSSSSKSRVDPLDVLLGIFDKFVQSYYRIAQKSPISKFNFTQIPSVHFGDTGDDNSAVYLPATHQIVVNLDKLLAYVDPATIVNEWLHYLKLQRQNHAADARYHLSISKIVRYLGNTQPLATIPHEILHAISSTTHGRGHPSMNFNINDTRYSNTSFDETGYILYSYVLEQGLVQLLV